jgi:two-component system, NtrC family, response regulator GlrR
MFRSSALLPGEMFDTTMDGGTTFAAHSDEVAAFGELAAQSEAMKNVFSRLRRLAERDTTLFIAGESGTGKDLVARAVHMASHRSAKPFVVVDCSAIPRTLIEAELFGHTKGAFTGAGQARPGKFLAADGGTIFLDEIGELDVDLQPRLLRVLERREVCPIGGTTPIPIDVRVISATNRDLRQQMRSHTFREDLFYRLAVAAVTLPPLRDRKEDIPVLVRRFLAEHASRDGQPYQLADATLRSMTSRSWPGNVRELRNAVEELVVFGDQLPPTEETRAAIEVEPGDLGLFKEEKSRVVNAFEARYLEALLARHRNNISASAVAAGIDRVHILRLLDKHGLRPREARS